MRIDKWLWAARFYKTRTLAGRACELGRVEIGGQWVKPAREVRVGEMLLVKTDGGDFRVEVLGLSEIRGPAEVARGLYRETEESVAARARAAEERRVMARVEAVPLGKPSKRDRRRMERVRGR